METVICRLCLEPIYNFICIDCLLTAVKQWLKKHSAEKLIPLVEKRHREITQLISSDFNSVICVKCKKESVAWACPCCYLYEMYVVVKSSRLELANEFERIFNFDFDYRPEVKQSTFWEKLESQNNSNQNSPIIINERKNRTDLNICENCGEASELKEINGRWLCESCKDEID